LINQQQEIYQEWLSSPSSSLHDYVIVKSVSAKVLDPKGHYQAIFKIDKRIVEYRH